MPRRPAAIKQADAARIIRAAKKAGAKAVTFEVDGTSVVVDLDPSTASDQPLENEAEIVL